MSVFKLKAIILSLLISGFTLASEPHSLIESMTDDLLTGMEQYRDTADENPEPFFVYLEERLDGVIDFKWIARNVMGKYRKTASDEQRARFAKVFRRGLVETYGRGLLAYSDEKIVVLPPAGDSGKKRVTVKQEIHGKDKVYPVAYSMGRNKQGQWKIVNVVIGGVNLGKTFRNQFTQAAQKHGGDVDKVIDNWSTKV
ncbi:ABC transporter substrate-binding protein [Porticoccus sp. W117]|uniref:MlaC/ttg2D family ABC transporter substrate-binding protein n=1 Tax=Porticoccus sp. W117 TaxID=3054777 RepID=UPI002593B40A|nr:ABC transporter substrate-binding protein [Porticoccus sp. W117]MDM3871272.1 ABC transporter substrate-binding protein [Porticoccus sp. W117]